MRQQGQQKNDERIDVDGLPHVGAVVYPGQAYYSKVDRASGESPAPVLNHFSSGFRGFDFRYLMR